MQKELYLTIEGRPGQEVQVWYRGSQSSELEDPAPIVFTGITGSDGRITVRVPRAHLCIGVPERKECEPYDFEDEPGDIVTVRLKTDSPSDELFDEKEEMIREPADHDDAAQAEAVSVTDETFSTAAKTSAAARSSAPRPWRVARSLLTLREQVNRLAPARNKASDGTIGDSRHCSGSPTASDHCAWIVDGANGVVSAMDITDDPAHGCSADAIAEAIRAARDGRVKYIIWNRRICSSYPFGGHPAWAWRRYDGSNPHTQHIHISVKPDRAIYDSTAPWII